ncbi:hypothetical protein NXX73_00140 [Bacteroides fragilis]|nr:hypothetical protein [Bacteroides fragilis]
MKLVYHYRCQAPFSTTDAPMMASPIASFTTPRNISLFLLLGNLYLFLLLQLLWLETHDLIVYYLVSVYRVLKIINTVSIGASDTSTLMDTFCSVLPDCHCRRKCNRLFFSSSRSTFSIETLVFVMEIFEYLRHEVLTGTIPTLG